MYVENKLEWKVSGIRVKIIVQNVYARGLCQWEWKGAIIHVGTKPWLALSRCLRNVVDNQFR